MAIKVGNADVSAVYYGSTKVNEVYLGAVKIWPAYRIVDTFTNTAAANLIWSVSGTTPTYATYNTAVEAGNGKCDVWTKANVLSSPLSRVEHVVFHVTDAVQQNSLLIGDSGQNIYLEYGLNGWGLGYYNGSQWIGMGSGGNFGLAAGGVIAVERVTMTSVRVTYNGNVLGTGSMPSNVATGLKVGFTLRAVNSWITWYRSPAIDDIRVIP